MAWTHLEDLMLCENKPGSEGRITAGGTQSSQMCRDREQNGGGQGLGEEEWELLSNRYRVPVLQDENSPADGWR